MKAHPFLTTLLAGIVTFASIMVAGAQKVSTIGDYPFWNAQKRGSVGQFVPGLNAVLQLSDGQKQQIAAARDEMMRDEGVKAARGISKNDPSVTAEQRVKARATMDAATASLHEKVATILTDEQKTLIKKINTAYAEAAEDIGIVYADKFGSVKADEAARRRLQDEKNQDTEEQFLHKLDGILTTGQRESMTRAAEEEEQRSAKASATKKPAKP